jgi:hypothetical protein
VQELAEYELYLQVSEKIINGEIRTFSALKQFAGKRNSAVVMQAFPLLKRLYWGFFSAITPKSHWKLWRELVIPDEDFPGVGDLKRTLQISDLYIAMLDIHGYTKFCMDSRKNLSMMHVLDRAIENGVSRISAACGAVSQRERGDEIVVVAASATDILTVTLGIIDYFSKSNIVSDPKIFTVRTGEAATLPNFKISAGITGGNTTSPLILTEKGNLSGFLLNSGARLQMRADELSPEESRVMIAKQVQMNFIKENAYTECALVKNNAIYFFNTGHIEFKGVMIPACEAVFDPNERYKEKLNEEILRLFDSIKGNLWEQRIFFDLSDLIAKAARVMPKFALTPSEPVEEQLLTNDTVENLSKKAMQAYFANEDYPLAVNILQKLIGIIEMIPSFDRLILDYLKGVCGKYAMLLNLYNENIDAQIDANAPVIFQGNYYDAWNAAKKGAGMYEKLRSMGRKSAFIAKKKKLWYNIIKQKQSALEFTLYSGKK